MRVMLLTLSLLLAVAPSRAAEAPTLTDVQRLQVQNLTQAIEIAQLRAKAAQHAFDTAKASLLDLLRQLQRPGYTLDVQTLTYTPIPTAEDPK